MSSGVMMTPALIIDGKIVVKGRVPSVEEIKRLITA
jgi:protein-disulfide isomerase